MEVLQPPGWPRPKGYANGIRARGDMVFIAGQVGWDEDGTFRSRDFVEQARKALENILTILAEAGGGADHIVRLTWFITDRGAYIERTADLGRAYREVMGRHYPAMSVVEVASLMEADALVEIEATAMLPNGA